MDEAPEIAALRAKLRDACEECPACGGQEADEAPAEELAAWLAGGDQHETVKAGWPAWHLDPAWREPAKPGDGRVVRLGEVRNG